jgi:hypothetical protein
MAGRCGFASRPPTEPQATLHQALLYKWALRWGIQINSERHSREIKIIWVSKIYNMILPICKIPRKIRNQYHV